MSETIEGADITVISGTELATYSLAGGDESVQFELDVTGNAGTVLEYNSINIYQDFTNGDSAYADSTKIQIDKNLITYQADINYDGRVSMMDLATLNAAAEAVSGNPSFDISSVNVNHIDGIDINDLEAMDSQWGLSLHDTQEMDTNEFTGTNSISIDLSGTTIGDTTDTTDNLIFITQNATEYDSSFVDSLIDSHGMSTHHDDANQFDGDRDNDVIVEETV